YLSSDQYKLYRLIYHRFIASQMAQAIYDTITADIEVNDYLFRANGQTLKFKGFMTLYVETADNETSNEEEDSSIPELTEGQEVKEKKLEPKQSFTQPPARYTEASLVKALEEKGIGRPSTYSPTITTIFEEDIFKKNKTTSSNRIRKNRK
ncbi:MAG: DNA topoisomerase, partial [Intestinibacter sp.]